MQFLITALWSTSGNTCENLDDEYSVNDIPEDFKRMCQIHVDMFIEKAQDLNLFTDKELEDTSTIEHDLWLTIHGHGAGFWDGDYKKGRELTELVKSLKLSYLQDELRDLID